MKYKIIKGGIAAPAGFLASGVACGIKRKHKLDLGLLYSTRPARTAAVFTTNRVKAAPVLWAMKQLKRSALIRALLVNSGCANACTGKSGLKAAEQSANLTGKQLKLPKSQVLVSSTGVIGKPLPLDCIARGVAKAASFLSKSANLHFARAILTTDLITKEIAVEMKINGKFVKIGGCTKGAGMVRPKMKLHATILGFLTTDADIALPLLKKILAQAIEPSFNSVTVDGDTSTNDSVFLMANGQSGVRIKAGTSGYRIFVEGLLSVCLELAKMIARDGEGSTKLIEVVIRGGRSEKEAKLAAFAIANSPLVKTAFFGQDANWGRILGAAGYSGAIFDPAKVNVHINKKALVRNGHALSISERQENLLMRPKELLLEVDLKAGRSSARVFTCDLTTEYIRINAKYRT